MTSQGVKTAQEHQEASLKHSQEQKIAVLDATPSQAFTQPIYHGDVLP